MPHEESTALEYRADYRTEESRTNKALVATKANLKSQHSQVMVEKAPPTNADIIAVSKPATKKLGLYKTFFACIMMTLAIAGVIALASALNRTTMVMSNSPTNAKYGNYIAPVVMHDPPPFEDSSHLDANIKIASSIWRNIFQKGASAYNEFDEQGLTLMPASDIQTACTELFGPSATINASENISGQFFSHETGEDFFHISAISNATSFVPYIDDITEKNDALSLAVSYLTRDDKYFSEGADKADTPSPVKRMVYNLKLNEATNKYYIQSVTKP